MNFFRRLQSLFSLPKWKCPKIHRRQPEISDKHCNQVGLGKKGARPHLVQDNRGKLPHFEHNAYLEELSARIQRELDETAAWIQHDLDETAAWIQRDLDKTAAWIQRDLDETAAWIQGDLDETATWIKCDLEKIESQIQQAPKLPEDKVQGDPEELATQIKRELEKLIAQLSLEGKVEQNQPKLEGKDEQIQCDLDETEAWIQSDLDETAFWIQCDLDKTAAWIQCDLDKTAAMIQLDLTKLEYDIQRDLTVPVDKIQGDLEDVSAHIQKDLNDLVAQLQFKQPKLEEKAALIPCDPEVKPATPHRDLVESPISISLENFVLHKVLGKGTFGKVMLAELKESGECFAMKALSKGSVLTNGYTHYTMIEKRVLKLAAENPFLVHLHSTFQTKDNLFFVMEYITGGDLFSLLEKKRRFDLVTTRFYAAELICGLQFLHRNGVIYRDLKLDNVMLDGDGHIKIVDFGLCRDNMFGDKRATSFCGSEHYIAPEIYQKREYSFAVDWWSFGVLLFEMLTGRAPFYGADYDELYMSVCWDIPPYPSWVKNKSKDLLIKLLDRDPRCRLGATGNIRAHSFFESIDWPALERREVEPPFKPEMEGHKDCSAFDKELLNEAPKLSQGDSKSIGPMDQSAFADFSFINPKCECELPISDAVRNLSEPFQFWPGALIEGGVCLFASGGGKRIYQKREYSFAVDWWSFGVLLFEMLTGRAPFYGADYDELYMSVCWDIPPYPSWVKNKSKDLLIKLLDRDPRCRLGATGNIRAHSFFESIDWPALERREVEPPFKPEMEGHKDCSAFDKELLNEAPKLSQGDSKSIGPMDQSAFADFSFINPKWCRAQ